MRPPSHVDSARESVFSVVYRGLCLSNDSFAEDGLKPGYLVVLADIVQSRGAHVDSLLSRDKVSGEAPLVVVAADRNSRSHVFCVQ